MIVYQPVVNHSHIEIFSFDIIDTRNMADYEDYHTTSKDYDKGDQWFIE